jgi:hypothetical protein
MKYKIESSGYLNTQVVEGYIELAIESLETPVYIDVAEVTSHSGHEVVMVLNFMGQEIKHREKVLSLIDAEKKDDDLYVIIDNDLISDLFMEYGENGESLNIVKDNCKGYGTEQILKRNIL